MGCFRVLLALLLLLLAAGFGLAGLCGAVLGNSSDRAIVPFLLLGALAGLIGGVVLLKRRDPRPPDNDMSRE